MMKPGDLVIDPDGYYGIVRSHPYPTPDAVTSQPRQTVDIFLGSGVEVSVPVSQVTPLGLRLGDGSVPPASFHEILKTR